MNDGPAAPDAAAAAGSFALPDDDTWLAWIERAVGGAGHAIVFQPIVDLRRRVIVGYEALSRFSVTGHDALSPDRWFSAADRLGLGPELQAAAIRAALAQRHALPANSFLTVNVDPVHLPTSHVLDALRSDGDLGRVVVEFTEYRDWEWRDIASVTRTLRELGGLIAIDDAGAGYSGLRQILRVRPEFLKLDRSLITGVATDEARAALIEMLGVFADRIDSWVLAEGVESEADASRVALLGVPLAQGYYFARPTEPWGALSDDCTYERPDDARPTGLRHLVEPAAAVPFARDRMGNDWLDQGDPWQVVVDDDARPMGVVDARSVAEGQIIPTLVANVSTRPVELAARLSTAAHHPAAPAAIVDDWGRYVGIVTIRRLLAELASLHDAGSSRSSTVRTVGAIGRE